MVNKIRYKTNLRPWDFKKTIALIIPQLIARAGIQWITALRKM